MALEEPIRYKLHLSVDVSESLVALHEIADERGDGKAFRDTLREFNRRLQIYPQFGDPIIDLHNDAGQVRIGIIHPLSIRYSVLEEHRVVFTSTRPVLLAKSKE